MQAVEAIAKILQNLVRVFFKILDVVAIDFIDDFLRTIPDAFK